MRRASLALIAISVFNENYSPTHYLVSVAFFVLAPISLFIINLRVFARSSTRNGGFHGYRSGLQQRYLGFCSSHLTMFPMWQFLKPSQDLLFQFGLLLLAKKCSNPKAKQHPNTFGRSNKTKKPSCNPCFSRIQLLLRWETQLRLRPLSGPKRRFRRGFCLWDACNLRPSGVSGNICRAIAVTFAMSVGFGGRNICHGGSVDGHERDYHDSGRFDLPVSFEVPVVRRRVCLRLTQR